MKRILFLHSSSDLYGASKIFLQSVKLMHSLGNKCIVILSDNGPLAIELMAIGIKVEIFNLGILRRKYFTPGGLLNRIFKWHNANHRIQQIISTENVDTVYSNTASVLIGAWAVSKINQKCTNNKVTHIWHLHEIIEKPYFLHRIIALFLLKFTHKIIVVSNAVREHWLSGVLNKSALQNKMFLVYNGILKIAPSLKPNYRIQYNLPIDSIIIGMAGRIHYLKGQQYFLEIAKELVVNDNIYFVITGDPFPGQEYLLSQMQEYIKNNKLEQRVIYTGYESDMDCFYAAIDILLLPSILPDSLPTVILESMQYGKPVIATQQGGALEMVEENETGIFIPLNDAFAAAKKITSILPLTVRTRMGANSKIRVNNYFSSAIFEQKLINVFEMANPT